MATYFDGEKILGVVSINGGSGTVYTVPANRYAKVNLLKVESGGGGTLTIGNATGAAGTHDFNISNIITNASNTSPVVFMNTGETIVLSSMTAFVATVLEFEKPA